MRQLRYATFLILVALAANSCKKQAQFTSFVTSPEITRSFTTGIWHLHSETAIPEDSSYNDYDFQFSPDNTIRIRHCKDTYVGKWSVTSDQGTDDAPPVDFDFSMIFTAYTPYKISRLSHNYHIIKRTATELELISLTPENPEKIRLEKSL